MGLSPHNLLPLTLTLTLLPTGGGGYMPFTALIVRLWKRGKGSPLRVCMPQGISDYIPSPPQCVARRRIRQSPHGPVTSRARGRGVPTSAPGLTWVIKLGCFYPNAFPRTPSKVSRLLISGSVPAKKPLKNRYSQIIVSKILHQLSGAMPIYFPEN